MAKPIATGAMMATAAGLTRAHGGDGRAHREHRPRHEGHSSSDRADCRVNDPVDRAVVSGQREQVGDADQDDEEAGREAVEDLAGIDGEDQCPDDEGSHQGERTHVHRPHGGYDEHQDKY